MSLAAGTLLGPYEIVSPLGAGGMGEVYRAKDTRLDRIVALKVLPAELATDPTFRARFDREARAISQLQHPHICTLYDVGDANGTAYLVMELLQGQTLAERLKKGALPIDEALRIAVDVADALAAAHKQGIVHRDLKPGNIMLVKAGAGSSGGPHAKLLDFGLAKSASPVVRIGGEGTTTATTGAHAAASTDITGAGTILGTLHYMAPEQVEGKDADARTDIWAFGAVLYEMLTGSLAFVGDSSAAVVGAILKDRPLPLPIRRRDAPAALEPLVRGCLEKDPEERWQSAADVARQLRGVTPGVSGQLVTHERRSSLTRLLPWAVAGLAAAAAAAVTLVSQRPAEPPKPVYASIELADGDVLGEAVATTTTILPIHTPMTFMPDGRSLILVVTRNGVHKLVSRPLDVSELREIAGTDGAEAVFVSPDGNWIGFWAANELRKVPVEGGVPTTIARVNATHGPNGVVWGPHDIIVYADAGTGQIMRVPATGAEPVPVTRTPASGRQYVTPFLLADGAHVLFADVRVLDDATDARLVVQSLEQDDAREVLKDASDPRVLPSGELAFMRMGTLMTVPFDSDRALPTSAPSTALDRVMQSGLRGSPGVEHPAAGMFAVSSLGALAVVRGAVVGPVQSRLVWAGHDGAVSLAEPANGAPVGARQQTRISPDGSRAVVSVVTPLKRELWIADWARDLWTRCSDCGAFRAEWAPDGRRLLLGRGNALVVHAIDNSSADEVLVEEPGDAIAVSPGPWLADGRIVYQSAPASDPAHSEIKVFDPATRSSRVVVPSGTGTEPAVSPNGRWLAYRKSAGLGDANVGQESTIFVQALSGSGFRTDVTPSGATNPYWSADGRALYYLAAASVAPGAVLFMVDIDDSDGRLVASRPREVLRYPDSQRCTPRRCFDISTDGSKFLFRARQQPNPVTSIDLILNWPAAVANKGDNAPRGR